MTPAPIDPDRPAGPARIVLSAFPDRAAALASVDAAVRRRLAACGTILPCESRYWWRGKVETQSEVLVLFKTVAKHAGALFRLLEGTHPYEVPEILEVDVRRVGPAYLRYLSETIDPDAPTAPFRGGPTRRRAPRDPAARAPGRTRVLHRRRSR